DLVVHNCNNGLMGADNDSGTLLLEYCEFYANGAGASAHQIYMATDESAHPGSVFRMQFCYMHDGAGGNNVKSRSERNEIYYNWIEGAFYHELELIGPDPAGDVPADLRREDSDVVGNVLRKKATVYAGGTFNVTRFGGDGTGESKGRYRVVNNTFIMGTSAAFRLFDSLESVEMHNNVFVSNTGAAAPIVRTVEALWTSGEHISGQNNWVQNVLTTIPSGWTGTIRGNNPGFRDLSVGDFTPASGSPLINGGTSNGQPPPGFAFTNPLFPPAFEPPVHTLLAQGSGVPRQIGGAIDIGAFEYRQSTDVPLAAMPEEFGLVQNYPNPFNPSTMVQYTVGGIRAQGSGPSNIRLVVYDLLGREVAVLVDERKVAGSYMVEWDGSDEHGRQMPSGVYLCRMTAGSFAQTKRMVLIR
ncbi:T9SS C-terminal target domain-containing protein, partial [bacterium]